MPRKPSQISKAIPKDPLERIAFFFSALVVALVLIEFFGCATAPPPPPKEITCLLRAPKPAKAPDESESAFPTTEPEIELIEQGALECYDPASGKGYSLPFEKADKFVCKPSAGEREQDLYLKLRGL